MTDTTEGIAQDAKDLRRGVGVKFLGYLIKLANPILLILLVRAYGSEAFGAFTLVQAVMLFTARVAALGLDKGFLWWIPQQDGPSVRRGVRPALLVACSAGLVVAVLLWIASYPPVLRLFDASPSLATSLRWMALGMVPQVAMDLLVHACMGVRRMGPQVLVKDALVPTLFVVSGLAFWWAGADRLGLPLAYVVSNVAGVVAAGVFFARTFRGSSWPPSEGWLPPRELVRYSIPMWLSEMTNSFLQRMDTYMVAAFVGDLSLLGIYAIVVRIANEMRDIRRSFDPIVLAIVARIGHRAEPRRLEAGFSYATFLVTLTQLPVFVFLLGFTRWLTPLYGPGFEAATVPVVVLCGFWLFNGLASLAGIVVSAYGRSRLTLFNTLFAIAVQAVSSYFLIPPFGLIGAAVAMGIAYTAQGCLQIVQMRVVTGAWNYNRSVFGPVLLGAISGGLMALVVRLGQGHGPPLAVRCLGFAAFAVVYLPGALRLWRTQNLRNR